VGKKSKRQIQVGKGLGREGGSEMAGGPLRRGPVQLPFAEKRILCADVDRRGVPGTKRGGRVVAVSEVKVKEPKTEVRN